MRWLLSILLAILATASAAQTMPRDTSTSVGRGQTFVTGWTASEYANFLGANDYYWTNGPGVNQSAGSMPLFGAWSSGLYYPIARIAYEPRNYGNIQAPTYPLDWFRTNHPDWIMYQADQLTPVNTFGNIATLVTVNIANPAVRQFIIDTYLAPALLVTGGPPTSLSIDNVTVRNDWGEVGTCSIVPVIDCTTDGGVWTALYTGAVNGDATFVANRLSWLQALTTWAHTNSLTIAANIFYDPAAEAGTASLIQAVDIWFDEQGYVGTAPAACDPTSYLTSRPFATRAAFAIGLNGGAGWPGVQQAGICVFGDKNSVRFDFAFATYLLTKNSYSYFIPYWSSGGGTTAYKYNLPGGLWPQMYWEHGAASEAMTLVGSVYRRTFANGIVVLNPSTTASAAYNFGASVYHGFDCARYTGTVLLPPITAVVAKNGEPLGCVP
jgi:hypothetical protein